MMCCNDIAYIVDPHHSFLCTFFNFQTNFYFFAQSGAGPKDGEVTEEIITASGKMVILDRLLTKLTNKGHRVVIFSQFTKSLDM